MTRPPGPPTSALRNPAPKPMGTPCPRCNAVRPGGWKGPCRHCLDARAPHAAVRQAANKRAAQQTDDVAPEAALGATTPEVG